MNQRPRGNHLVSADRGFATGGGMLARLFGGGFNPILDRVDRGLSQGAIEAILPDGSRRTLGGRAAGPIAIVHLRSWRPLVRLATSGSVGWYKAWEQGEWTSPDPVPLFGLFMRNGERLGDTGRAKGLFRLVNRLSHRFRDNDKEGARRNISHHYDLGNDFYAAWLDESLTYSSAIFAEPITSSESLEDAQARKLRLLLDRLALKPGQRLLEIGCGWGSLAEAAVRDHQVDVVGLTLSKEQKDLADQRLAEARCGDRVSIELKDYRDADGVFDAVASVEMVEAVGQDYWPSYLRSIARVLKPGGRAALQLIAIKESLFEGYASNADFIQTYIFPGGMLISEERFRAIAQDCRLEWRDRRGYGLHYAETLKRWRERYDRAVAERRLPPEFDEQFHKLWRYYLMYCEGGFRGGGIDVAQVTLVKR
ncbi:cyclopropane-fatty-acyl-phospholipid synthase family protein [Sphingosinicella rhizophila]|uniref:Cyclopropane-fatty-acyl-phospholipid synthase family protein n=1 Tax=Sphingosinicella rhizophila TaxID=3050082 RepID=A0ABU3Q3A1_9SPHN|nr:cyclopropane-fatty-acyl-phospholipid synthase family protein [Sphingosinicella sp. GR2756]MDT9597890.1 cyclopropane-fatty-acyl-phospholipid synthase family protein [Sphingosinicella sp. GR2756]